MSLLKLATMHFQGLDCFYVLLPQCVKAAQYQRYEAKVTVVSVIFISFHNMFTNIKHILVSDNRILNSTCCKILYVPLVAAARPADRLQELHVNISGFIQLENLTP